MGWMRATFEGPDRVAQFEALRGAFIALWWDHAQADTAALYVGLGDGDEWPPTIAVYLSPRAAGLTKYVAGVSMEACGRPAPEAVWLAVGASVAADPLWADLPESVREAIRQEEREAWSPIERQAA